MADTLLPKGPPTGHAIIAGFGVPGRAVAELLEGRGIACTVIETNPSTVLNAGKPGRPMVCGDATDPDVLREAGIERASLLVVAIPDQRLALIVTREARRLNPTAQIVTRTHFTSAGIEARRLGATDVVVAEQAVAHAFCDLLSESSTPSNEPTEKRTDQ